MLALAHFLAFHLRQLVADCVHGDLAALANGQIDGLRDTFIAPRLDGACGKAELVLDRRTEPFDIGTLNTACPGQRFKCRQIVARGADPVVIWLEKIALAGQEIAALPSLGVQTCRQQFVESAQHFVRIADSRFVGAHVVHVGIGGESADQEKPDTDQQPADRPSIRGITKQPRICCIFQRNGALRKFAPALARPVDGYQTNFAIYLMATRRKGGADPVCISNFVQQAVIEKVSAKQARCGLEPPTIQEVKYGIFAVGDRYLRE